MPNSPLTIKSLYPLLRNAISLIVALALASCAQVTCDKCFYGEYAFATSEQASTSQRQFPALKYAHQPSTSAFRHVYLEGDGNAWHKGRVPSINPTSRQKLALRLMLMDSNDSIYLDRPCYGYKAMPESCDNTWWTSARYSEAIVIAMNEALDGLQAQLGEKPLILIGHSGGGALAVLLAQRRSDVRGIVTLAGNLAPHQWAEHHGYLPLEGSLSPELNSLSSTVLQRHYAGDNDSNVPPHLIKSALKGASHAEMITLKGNHTCCWRTHWPSILEHLDVALTNAPASADDMAHK